MLKIDKLFFSYGQKKVLTDLSLTLSDGEILAIMGPSGCGKTTLLNLVAGTVRPTGGVIEKSTDAISYVFQEPRLFPWLTVKENLLAVTGSKAVTDEEIAAVLEVVELSGCEQLFPSELSGGMKIRVSLARAMIADTKLWLLDEPFASLDADLRKRLIARLRSWIKENGISALVVTHFEEDATMLADRIFRF